MNQQVTNYTVVIEKQKRLGTNNVCYMAYVPVLGIATDADTIEQLEKDITALIKFHVESLANEGETIPIETKHTFVTRSEVMLPKGAVLAY